MSLDDVSKTKEKYSVRYKTPSKREEDKLRAKELIKKYPIRPSQKELAKLKKVTEFAEKLNKNTKQPTNYTETLEFSLYIADQLGRKSDVKFLKSLPDGDDSVFENIPEKSKKRFYNIILSIKEHFANKVSEDKTQVKVITGEKDILLKAKIAYLKDDIDKSESELSKKDFPTGWECAVFCKKMYYDGELPNDVKSITDSYRWGVKHCTIKGEEIERYTKIASAYDNTKHNRTKGGTAIDKFEEEYKDKIN